MMPWRVAWWLNRAGRGRKRPLRKLRARLARWFRPLRLEELESRLAPTADLVYNWTSDHSPFSGANVSLRVADHDGSTWLQIVDTDTASDDAVALIMALRAKDVQVEAITVVSGNVPLAQGGQPQAGRLTRPASALPSARRGSW